MPAHIPIEERLVKYSVLTVGGCIEWTGYRDPKGYGRMSYQGKSGVCAYRVSYITRVGPVPDGLELDHLCRNRACINPHHLEPVTRKENVRRGNSPTMILHRSPTCIHGHERNETNTYRGPKSINCRVCNNIYQKRRLARVRPKKSAREAA